MNSSTLYILVTLIILFDSTECSSANKNVIDSTHLTRKIGANRTISVDVNGKSGDFTSVQAAIDEVPNGNSEWVIIRVKKGVYRERVRIPHDKPYIFVRGEGRAKTSIVWSESSEKDYESATLKVEAPHFVGFGISFKNTAPAGVFHTVGKKTVAAYMGADKASFYQCGFSSNGNTIFDDKGKHYYDRCHIQGSTDLVFGRGQAMFHDCEVFVIGNPRVKEGGSIAASHRESHEDKNGFVFVKGKVYGVGNAHLGRAQGSHSRVVFVNTYLSKAVIPQGWTIRNDQVNTKNLHHAEYKCYGPGADPVKRAHWSKQLADKEAAPFRTVDFIKGLQWLPAWF